MNATTAFGIDLSPLAAKVSSASLLLAIAATAVVGLLALFLYIFYPAILAARQPTLEPCRIEILHKGDSSPSVHSKTSTLSIIIPAYNEQDRLLKMIQAAVEYLSAKNISNNNKTNSQQQSQQQSKALQLLHCTTVEWILVSDGSTDETESVYREFVAAWAMKHTKNTNSWTWKLLVLPRNAGKGAAVRTGMLHSVGVWKLMVDADGATDFGVGLEQLTQYAEANDVIIGSRAHLQKSNTAAAKKRSFLRQGLMHAFQFLCVVLVGATEIEDTQCGFKLFSSSAANKLFANLHLRGWAFDTELIYMVKRFQMKIKEVAVPWQEVEGSKLHTSAFNLAFVAVAMLRDMVCVRLCYTLGLWSVRVRQGSLRKGSVSIPRKRRKED
jgi:dolichyl-phosphate beta-glucosyltransferase